MDVRSPTTPSERQEVDKQTISACAQVCGIAEEFVERICIATPEQIDRMDSHLGTGSSYMMQMVLQYEGDLNPAFLLRVLGEMRIKNHVLCTRLAKHEDKVYQLVLGGQIPFEAGVDLPSYLAKNSRTRMCYGTPLCRYALIREARGDAFFVWTAHGCIIDAWTLRLMFDDLQTACSDLAAYSKLPPRPPFGWYAKWLESYSYEAGFTFWLTRHTSFENIIYEFPILRPAGSFPTSSMNAKKLLHLPSVERKNFSLSSMGHAAWALTVQNRKMQEHPLRLNEDVSFLAISPARSNSTLPNMAHMMGPVSARVPLRFHLFHTLPVETLMRDIDAQFSSMIGFEHCAIRALNLPGAAAAADFGTPLELVQAAVFAWHPPGADIAAARIVCHDRDAAPAVLAYREDLSSPLAHDFGLLVEVYEHGDHVSIYASWDPVVVAADLVARLLEDFEFFLSVVVKRRLGTVGELLSAYRACRAGPVAGFES